MQRRVFAASPFALLGALLGALACAPGAASSTPMDPIALDAPQVQPVEATGVLVYAQIPDPLELRARPEASAPGVEIAGELRAVEVLHERDGWWEVRTLGTSEVIALGLPSEQGVAMLELHGWTPALPTQGLTMHPLSPAYEEAASRTALPPPDSPALVDPTQLPFVIPAGATLYWPDGSEAGSVRSTHGFYTAARSHTSPERVLMCHAKRSSIHLGIIEGELCVDLEQVRDRGSHAAEAGSPILALDTPPSPESAPANTGTPVQGALDRDQIREVVRANIEDIRGCYNTGLAKVPDLAGRVSVNFVITGDGSVGSAVVQASDLGMPAVETCICEAAKNWQFPPPRGGGNVIVTYPFNLTPG